jgi:hypothetical protein
LDTSWIYARCELGRRTVDIAVSPVCSARMLVRCEFCTTKKKPSKVHESAHTGKTGATKKRGSQLTTIPNSTPITKSHTVMQIIILTMVMYSDLSDVFL